MVELGISTFGETTPLKKQGKHIATTSGSVNWLKKLS